jgi:putative acetyltransferase
MESIRLIEPKDNVALAAVIRAALTEFGANKPGTVYYDPTTDHLFELFQTEGSVYYVAEIEGILVGGCGIFPTEGLPDGTCELVKLYLAPSARGTGLGKALMLKAMAWAKKMDIRKCILKQCQNYLMPLRCMKNWATID